jgi:non-heme chloroperoxidase
LRDLGHGGTSHLRGESFPANWNVAAGASAAVSLAYVATWHEDFREDVARIDVPMLVIQGDADRILPIMATGLRTARLIKGARLLVAEEGPHAFHGRMRKM